MRHTVLVALLSATLPAFAQSSLTADWQWKAAHRCNNTSPALTISGIPEGTKSLAVKMNDLDFRNKDHGGGTVAHGGEAVAEIPEGALTADYLGPCPANFASFGHSYQITVRALAADGSELARSVKAKDFSASTAK
ncbi:MAG TPA: hypothetical protein VF096_13330 [Azonexus sp.]